MANMFARAKYGAKLHAIRTNAKPQRATDSGSTGCQRSGVCCWTRPCDLHPGDEEKIATHLGTTTQELFREYLVVDDMDDGKGLRLLPRRGQQSGGRYLTAAETYDADTACVFLDTANGNACKVHAVKPTGGARFVCTMSESEVMAFPAPGWTHEQLSALGWDGEKE